LILVSLFLNIPRLFQNLASIIFGPLNKFVVHLTTQLSALLPLLVSSRLDYANSILYGIPAKHISRLQRTQNTLAHVVTGTGFTVSSSFTLKRLHWLPIDARIKFKIATLTFKALNTGNPPYLASLLHRHNPCRVLRSASANVRRTIQLIIWLPCLSHCCSDCLEQSPSSCPLLYYSHNIP